MSVAVESFGPRVRTVSVRSLDELTDLGSDELADLYRTARTPRLRELDGVMVGRMLATPHANGIPGEVLRSLARAAGFPWRGKSFRARNDERGEGVNRLFSDENPREWFRFETSVNPSRAGDFDAVQLNYDVDGNPRMVRRVRDELREVAPGLYLGRAYVLFAGDATLVAYFGLTRRG